MFARMADVGGFAPTLMIQNSPSWKQLLTILTLKLDR